jgi:hypothetical protein
MNAEVRLAALLALAAVAWSPASGRAAEQGREAHERRLGQCILDAAGGSAWLEKTLWGLRDQEAGHVGLEMPNRDGSHDLGPLQVNSWWVPKLARRTGKPAALIRWWLVHDPCFNVNVARWIFLTGLAQSRDYWKAVGAYHSPTLWRQRTYAARVAQRMRARFGPRLFEATVRPAPPKS